MNRWRIRAAALLLIAGVALAGEADAYQKQREEMTRNALEFLARCANPDGSFGSSHRRLQTGLTLLAFLSAGERPGEGPYGEALAAACRWLLGARAVTGFAGDKELPTESHAIAGMAFAELVGMGASAEDDGKLYEAARAALEHTLETQDKAYGGRYNGGWKAEPRDKLNDRKASAWQLAFVQAMDYCGVRVSKGSLLRGVEFMKGSFKPDEDAYGKHDVGGFSYDAEGLPVRSISAAGLYCMELFDQPAAERELAADWLAENPPIWNGPHFYYTQFFAVRALRWRRCSDGGEKAQRRFEDYFRKVTEILRGEQRPDGSFGLPPGNAEYTKQMGATYATAMAVLILNCNRNLLPVDMVPEVAQAKAAPRTADEDKSEVENEK